MLESVTLDQLRMFVAAAEEGSFSAAARRLLRSQSAISEAMGTLEGHLQVSLFDRTGRRLLASLAGKVLLADARRVLAEADALKAHAKGMAAGVEPELAVAVDVFFPIRMLASAATDFGKRFPATPLRLHVEALGAAAEPVIDGRVNLGILGSLPLPPSGLNAEMLGSIRFLMVAAASHPLASRSGIVGRNELARHVQLVLTDRSALTADLEMGVLSPVTWRLSDLFTKHAFLLEGLGFGGMPSHMIEQDLIAGRLVVIEVDIVPKGGLILPLSAVFRTVSPPGPAGRWLIHRLQADCRLAANETATGAAT